MGPSSAGGGAAGEPPPPPPEEPVLRQRGGGGGSGSGRRTGGMLVAAGILVLVALAGAGAWYGIQSGLIPLGPGASEDGVPLLTADAEPLKVRPEDRGGMTIPDQDKQIYERLAGGEPDTTMEERLLPPPELPLTETSPAEASAAETFPAETLAGQVAQQGAMSAIRDGSQPLADAVGSDPAASPQDVQVAPLPEPGSPSGPAADSARADGPTPDRPVAVAPDTAMPDAVAGATGQQTGRPERIEDLLPPTETGAASEASPGPSGTASVGAPGPDATPAADTAETQPRGPENLLAGAPDRADPPAVPPPPSVSTPPSDAASPADTASSPDAASSPDTTTQAAAPVEDITPEEPAVSGARAEAAAQTPAQRDATPTRTAALPAGATLVQLAAVREAAAAQAEWARLQSRHGAVLGGLTPRYEQVDIPDRGLFTRIQAGPFADAAAAARACETLKAEGQGCFVVRP